MHFEGGMVAIDHGQGLITTYLHQSALAVEVGQRVTPGTLIGYVGSKGRATGPHLCWRMRWRGRNLDPSLRVRSG
jgi:murein DD-endopeptidase MepM/ murein hydrolase activator NlpD